MRSAARSTGPSGPQLSLTLCLALLLIGAVVAAGIALGVQNYTHTSRIVLNAADAVMSHAAREVALELERTTAPARTLVAVVARQSITTARSVDERMREVPVLAEALRTNPALAAVYVGYADGAFFLVRSAREDATRNALGAPAGTAFIAQSIEAGSTTPRFFYFRDDLGLVGSVDRSDFSFDPRTRSWYREALAADESAWIGPYVFFTTREPGITFARRAASGNSVVGADITLASLSRLLAQSRATPSSQLFLLANDGRVVAHDGVDPLAHVQASVGLRLSNLDELAVATAQPLAVALRAGTDPRRFEFAAGGRDWLGSIQAVASSGHDRLHLVVASPTDELLGGVREMRERDIAVTSGMVVLAIPLAWLVASGVSRPLRKLADDARAIEALNFNERAPVRSIVREVDQLGVALRTSTASMRRFTEISGTLANERRVEQLIAHVLEETMQLAKADAACLHLVDPKRRRLDFAAYARRGEPTRRVDLPSLPLEGAAAAAQPVIRAALEATTTLTDLPSSDPGARRWLGEEAERIGTGALAVLAIPLCDRSGQVIGVLSLLSAKVHAVDVRPQVVAFIEKLSGVAAISIETQRLIAEQKRLLEAFIQLVAAAIDAKSPYTSGHCQRVPELTKMLAKAACDAREGPFRDFRLNDDEWEAVHIASWLHDCGKVTTPEYVVDKATKLETIYDRIHEIRMRFEVLKRDAEIDYWKARASGDDETSASARLALDWQRLDDDFAFIARCNEGGESMDAAAVSRIRSIAQRTWRRTLDDRLGISWEELRRKERAPARTLPATEQLLSDAPEHIVERRAEERIGADNRWGFRLTVPEFAYNRGELHNLCIARGTLTDEERYKINDHIVQTIVMLDTLPFPRHLQNVPEIAGGHHETMDGRGYPRRLDRSQMSPLARMMAIADIFEALTAVDRPYKKGKTLSESIRIMARMRDNHHIDADLFDLFLESGVYRRYAERFLRADQIDDVDVAACMQSALTS
jgi:HD-GYP domain-containing protein (c-di-GMP phosphodiesterase class II)